MKVHLISDNDWWYKPLRSNRFVSDMVQVGVEWAFFNEWNCDCDLVISHPYLVPESYSGPLVIFENWETCQLQQVSRKLLQTHDVRRIIKVMSYSQLDLHNCLSLDQRVMGKDCVPKDDFIRIGQAEFEKIEVLTTAAFEMCSWWPVVPREKDIDIAMCIRGRAAYERMPRYEHHRRMACEAMVGLPLDVVQVLYYGAGAVGNYFDGEYANQILRRSKLGVSPFGVSEMSIRDYQTVLACATLVKPRCWMTLDPDPFQNAVWCSDNYCDFSDAVERAIGDYCMDQAVKAASGLMDRASMSRLAYRVASIAERAK